MIAYLAEQTHQSPGDQIAGVLVILFVGIMSIMIARS